MNGVLACDSECGHSFINFKDEISIKHKHAVEQSGVQADWRIIGVVKHEPVTLDPFLRGAFCRMLIIHSILPHQSLPSRSVSWSTRCRFTAGPRVRDPADAISIVGTVEIRESGVVAPGAPEVSVWLS